MSNREFVNQKKEALIEMTDSFAGRYLDEDYKILCRKLIDKMSRKRQVPFLTGRPEIWAAAVVYALGQLNFLFDKSFEPYVLNLILVLLISVIISGQARAQLPRKQSLSATCSK